ncbi:MAG TPA: hypothetical protein VFW40_01615 [Capsulimonadaceae bacterium]|nr:hypothetical protein [Capsulimonadaceae bacterium]
MKSVNLGFTAALLVLLVSIAAQAAPSTVNSTPAATSASSYTAADADWASALQSYEQAKAAHKDGALSEIDLLTAQIASDEAHLQAALAHGDSDAISKSLGDISGARQEQAILIEAQYQAGVVNQKAVLDARKALIKAQVREQLYQLETLEQQDVANTQHLYHVGVVSQSELEKAQADLKKAQDAFDTAQP